MQPCTRRAHNAARSPGPAASHLQDHFAQARSLFLEGVSHFEAGRLPAAQDCFVQSLQHLPGRASTRINLAATRLRLGRAAEAQAELQAVLAAEPQHLDGWGLLAEAQFSQQDDAGVLASTDHALQRSPDDGSAWYWRGRALERQRRHAEAQAAFERLVALQPAQAEAWFRLGQLQQRQGKLDAALHSLDQAVAHAPASAPAWSQRGLLLKEMGRRDEATSALERALALGADAPLHRFYLAALRGEAMPEHPPRAYVQSLFDDYADGFDRHLVEVLGYRAHERLVQPLAALQPAGFERALDLGCGTGLCAPLLRPQVRQLHGVDLSPPMLQRAAALGLYDRLDAAELVEHLQHCEQRYDLLVAAGVFIYVGELWPVFQGVQRVLRPGGLLAFSVERGTDETAVTLTPQLRYAHGQAYLQDLAVRHGLQWLRADEAPIRHEQQQAIDGLYVYLRRP